MFGAFLNSGTAELCWLLFIIVNVWGTKDFFGSETYEADFPKESIWRPPKIHQLLFVCVVCFSLVSEFV